MDFPAAHRTKLHSTNPLNGSTAKSSAGPMSARIFPNEEAITRLVAAILAGKER